MNLVASASELGDDVLGEKLRVAAGGVDFRVPAEQAIEHGFEVVEQLDFVEQENGIRVLFHFFPGELVEGIGITVFLVVAFVKSHLDDPLRQHTMVEQIVPENGTQQIGFAASPKAGNDLDESIVLLANELVEVKLPLNFHNPHS